MSCHHTGAWLRAGGNRPFPPARLEHGLGRAPGPPGFPCCRPAGFSVLSAMLSRLPGVPGNCCRAGVGHAVQAGQHRRHRPDSSFLREKNSSFFRAVGHAVQASAMRPCPKHAPPGSRKPGDAPVRSASSPARGAVKARPKVCPLAAADPADVRAAAAVARALVSLPLSLSLSLSLSRGSRGCPVLGPHVRPSSACPAGCLPPRHWQ